MGLNWSEIKSRALLFSKTWADASNEDSEAKPFWIDFFEIFGITDKRVATFELNVKKLCAVGDATNAERVTFPSELSQGVTRVLLATKLIPAKRQPNASA
jgi:hypothetical protein